VEREERKKEEKKEKNILLSCNMSSFFRPLYPAVLIRECDVN